MENIIYEVKVHFLKRFKQDSAYINTFKWMHVVLGEMMGGDAILAKNNKRNDALAIGVGIGVVIGVFQGHFTNNLVIGIVIGIIIGIAFLKK